MTDELSPELVAAAKQIAEERFNELIASKATEHEAQIAAAQDQGYAAGAATVPGGGRREYSNGQMGAPVFDPGFANYEQELKTVVSDLREQGVRNLRNHPSVLALRARHGR